MTTDEAIKQAQIVVNDLRLRVMLVRGGRGTLEVRSAKALVLDEAADAMEHLIEIARCRDDD